MRFHKYHALGNDYIVLDPADFPDWDAPSRAQTRVICHRNFGVGSDGILWGPLPSTSSQFGLRIFNPDGSEAEKSGNGLRIFSRYLWDSGQATASPFTIETPGGDVTADILPQNRLITVDMGRVSFDSDVIPVRGEKRDVLNESITIGDRTLKFCAATIGNPHCVLPLPAISAALAHELGPLLEVHPQFPHKTNVQFLEVIDRGNIRIEIWERGAGYTLASGSSSSAAAAVAHRLGLVDDKLTVHMPGGTIGIEIAPDYAVRMTGSVNQVAVGEMQPDLFEVEV
ncbi:diaminopimelate epimerase [Synoicihabitans lomoniglobus]|uniref:Diaminopimelate epimerase n=1 Tax=Synoicihabitans lomoniglobus TaxID=2909285 RepID=A0AAF0CSC5_9BACT|nr:diaminopimelate epimerase [Opitutaceae bacterium LMO-M01]WED67147.1 diaminopimelate epimerase [Opitutaceae bacterium LMO-M01]